MHGNWSRTGLLHWAGGILMLVPATTAHAYIDMPAEQLTLPRLLLEFRTVGIFQVERVDLERGAVRYKLQERLQGSWQIQESRHSIRLDGKVPAELGNLRQGQSALLFTGDNYSRGIVLVEGAWYCCTIDADSWWRIAYTAGHYDFHCAGT